MDEKKIEESRNQGKCSVEINSELFEKLTRMRDVRNYPSVEDVVEYLIRNCKINTSQFDVIVINFSSITRSNFLRNKFLDFIRSNISKTEDVMKEDFIRRNNRKIIRLYGVVLDLSDPSDFLNTVQEKIFKIPMNRDLHDLHDEIKESEFSENSTVEGNVRTDVRQPPLGVSESENIFDLPLEDLDLLNYPPSHPPPPLRIQLHPSFDQEISDVYFGYLKKRTLKSVVLSGVVDTLTFWRERRKRVYLYSPEYLCLLQKLFLCFTDQSVFQEETICNDISHLVDGFFDFTDIQSVSKKVTTMEDEEPSVGNNNEVNKLFNQLERLCDCPKNKIFYISNDIIEVRKAMESDIQAAYFNSGEDVIDDHGLLEVSSFRQFLIEDKTSEKESGEEKMKDEEKNH